MSSFIPLGVAVAFNATSSGAGSFVVASAYSTFATPEKSDVVNGKVYKYYAQSSDGAQWEYGFGAYNTSTHTLARTTISQTSNYDQVTVGFTTVPIVSVFPTPQLSLEPIILSGSLFGLTLSTSGASTSFTVAAGQATDSTGVDVLSLSSTLTKTTATWAVGAAGALDTGAIAATTWYFVHLIKRLDTGVVDVLLSLSPTAPTLPANYTLFRRIGAMGTNVSSQWSKFTQLDDTFLWDADDNGAAPFFSGVPGVTTAVLKVVTVPLGIKVTALIRAAITGGATGANVLYTSPDVSDQSASVSLTQSTAAGVSAGTEIAVRTNTSGQVRIRTSTTTASLYITTSGWIDTRGKGS